MEQKNPIKMSSAVFFALIAAAAAAIVFLTVRKTLRMYLSRARRRRRNAISAMNAALRESSSPSDKRLKRPVLWDVCVSRPARCSRPDVGWTALQPLSLGTEAEKLPPPPPPPPPPLPPAPQARPSALRAAWERLARLPALPPGAQAFMSPDPRSRSRITVWGLQRAVGSMSDAGVARRERRGVASSGSRSPVAVGGEPETDLPQLVEGQPVRVGTLVYMPGGSFTLGTMDMHLSEIR